jgi:hypothetical protein
LSFMAWSHSAHLPLAASVPRCEEGKRHGQGIAHRCARDHTIRGRNACSCGIVLAQLMQRTSAERAFAKGHSKSQAPRRRRHLSKPHVDHHLSKRNALPAICSIAHSLLSPKNSSCTPRDHYWPLLLCSNVVKIVQVIHRPRWAGKGSPLPSAPRQSVSDHSPTAFPEPWRRRSLICLQVLLQ